MSDNGLDSTATPVQPVDPVDEFKQRASTVRNEMGGVDKLARLADRGERTIREQIDGVLDDGTFREVGTFSQSLRSEDRGKTPGDGKIGGHGLIDGRPVTIFGDDITVMRGSSSIVGTRKEWRLHERAIAMGQPIVHFGQTGGGRIPDIMGSEGISEPGQLFDIATRRHQVPMATAIVGQSFGGSSFISALSDFVVMTRGSCLAVTSPRVFEVATGEITSFEDVGGVDVHATKTGQIDLGVETDEQAWEAMARWLSYLPSSAHQGAPRGERPSSIDPDPTLADLVPTRRQRGYDMRKVITRLADPDSVMELQPRYARQVTAALARIDGLPIGVIANNTMYGAGAMTPETCHKIIRFMTVCDSFNLPVVFLVDVPGFMVGTRVEHDRLLHWGMRMMTALQLASTPTLTVCLRKAFGMAWQAMNGSQMPSLGVYAWPGAEIGFMDPEVGINVAYGARLAAIEDEDEREAERVRLVHGVQESTSPYEAAGTMRIDEIIDPAETRVVLAEDLNRLSSRPIPSPEQRPLSYWPSC